MTRALCRFVALTAIIVATATVATAQTTCVPPSITSQPQDQTITAGNSATLTATATGTGLSYQWFRNFNGNWVSIAGATSPSITVSPAATTVYRLTVFGSCGTATSDPATVTICTPPTITTHPESTTVETGGRVTLTVAAVGSSLRYQWYNGSTGNTSSPVVGATKDTLTILAVNSSRSYWVKVYNTCGVAESKTARITIVPNCEGPAIAVQPASTTVQSGQSATLSVTATGTSPSYQWYIGPSGNTTNAISGATQSTLVTPPLTTATSFWVRVANSCGSVDSAAALVTVTTGCVSPSIVAQPQGGDVAAGARATLTVAANGSTPFNYQWYRGASGDTSNPYAGATSSSFTTPPVTATTSVWVRVSNGCGQVDSLAAVLNLTCPGPTAPDAKAPAQVLSGTTYSVTWDPIAGASRYDIDEADNPEFAGATTTSVAATEQTFAHTTTEPKRFHYRVRAFGSCDATPGQYSVPESVAVIPPPSGHDLDPNATAPEGSVQPVMFQYLLMPPAGKNALDTNFSANTDKPWMTASPASGTIPPGGVTVTVAASPSSLPTGTNTGTLNVTTPTGATLASVPMSVTVVTPVTTVPKGGNQENALILPVVGHAAGGASSMFLSDIRFTNTSDEELEYLLIYTQSRTSGDGGKQSRITVRPHETKAINDVVKSWFGFGSTGESALGTLEIRPINYSGKKDVTRFATVASSRTYNMTPQGTFGQFIPAIPFAQFAGKGTKISLQQIAQSADYRTNFGIVEGSGAPATAQVRVYNAAGQKVGETTLTLMPFEHQQWNRFLETLNIANLPDGRIEVEATSATGRITAYASVVDNHTNDPLLVFPVVPSEISARRFVLPGVADLNTGSASWRTDIRVYNAGPAPVTAVMSFQQSRRADGTLPGQVTRGITLQPGHVTSFDNVLHNLFGTNDAGGAIQIMAPTSSSLVVTARTYDRRTAGTYGQFIPAVTAAEGVGIGDRPLEVLQVEQSARYRTNLGLAETSGNPVMVEIHAIVPDAPVAVRKEIYLAANEFVQINRVLETMQIPTAYNARITVRAIGGTGRVTAYASVVDNQTQDPTYVPAQ